MQCGAKAAVIYIQFIICLVSRDFIFIKSL